MAQMNITNTIGYQKTAETVEYKQERTRGNAGEKERKFRVDAVKDIPDQERKIQNDEEKRLEEKKETIQNLASVSEDGDTVQVSPQGNDRFAFDKTAKVTVLDQRKEEQAKVEEKRIQTKKEEKQRELKELLKKTEKKEDRLKDFDIHMSDEEKADKKAWKFDEEQEKISQPSSTIGQTESQIQKMYRDGDISKHEYDQAIEIREKRKSEIIKDDDQFSKETVQFDRQKEQAKQDEVELKELYAEDSSETLQAVTRAEIISSLQDFAIAGNN